MRVYSINSFGNLSTGTIAVDIARLLNRTGHQARLAYARGKAVEDISSYRIGSAADLYFHAGLSRITDRTGSFSTHSTHALLRDIQAFQPDIIHLHNLHGYYLNYNVLFHYLQRSRIPVVWTLHDCWSYTGHCCYYSRNNCQKWKNECRDCQYLGSYPASIVDHSRQNYHRKRELFCSLKNMVLVPVSYWLENELKKSFLRKIPSVVIQNGIDLDVFKPTSSEFRKRHGLERAVIILGVASTWDERKGLQDFIELSKIISPPLQIVLVGLNDRQLRQLPENVIGMPRTSSVQELVELYSTADVYVNASVEETFGLPTVEAMACGTPSIVYRATALPEVISPGNGFVVEPHDVLGVKNKVLELLDKMPTADSLRGCSRQYDKNVKYEAYLQLYMQILGNGS